MILEEFWYGNIQPNERDVVPNSRLAKLLKLVAKNEENLTPTLSEDARSVFEKLKDSQDELSSINERDSFVLGFVWGQGLCWRLWRMWMCHLLTDEMAFVKKRNFQLRISIYQDQFFDYNSPFEGMPKDTFDMSHHTIFSFLPWTSVQHGFYSFLLAQDQYCYGGYSNC